ncbi:MAG: hypothetical protein FWH06_07995 [Oscillospiraceae bacterium]|nr:hypothetical protein [Oscillospiraceae bacterium]
MSVGIKERLGNAEEQQHGAIEKQLINARVAMPGIIVSFDPGNQTAAVQPAITENVQIGGDPAKAMNLPILTDVPVQFPRAGGYCLTFPVKRGDECLLVFGDMCIDGWWQSGGVQDQMETRRHDLSDAMAVLGVTSVPNAVTSYATDCVMLRNEGMAAYIKIDDGSDITVVTKANVNISASADVSISAAGNMKLTAGGTLTLTGAAVNIN